MGRPARHNIDGGWYHVMNRGVAAQQIFSADSDRVDFERLLGVGHGRFRVEVHAYCLMGNHFHLLLHCPVGGLSTFMQQLGSVYVRHFNERVGRDGPLFRSRFHAIPVDSDGHLLTATRYIHQNPLDLGFDLPLDRYRWSSHRIYLGRRSAPSWFREDTILGVFGGDRAAFDDFVRGGAAPVATPVSRPSLGALIELVVDELQLDGARQGLARTVGLMLLDQADSDRARELRVVLGCSGDEAERAAIRRARRRLAARPDIDVIIDRVRRLTG